MPYRLADRIAPWVDAAIDRFGQGENIGWEPQLLPDEQGQPLLTVFVWFPGAVLGTTLNGSFQVHDPLGITEEKVTEVIQQFLHALREARSAQIAQQKPETPVPPRGGQTASGLIIA